MSAYLVLKECAYINADGAAVHHMEGGSVAEIPEDVAKGLGDAVRPMVTETPLDVLNPTPFPDATVSDDQGPGRRGKRTTDAAPGEAGNG